MSNETRPELLVARLRELGERIVELESRLESIDTISHELNDVLTSVFCNTAVAIDGIDVASPLRAILEETETALVRARDLTHRRLEVVETAAERQDEACRASGARDGSILVVDTDECVRRVTERILSCAGWRAVSAADGIEAIERFEAARRRGRPFRAVIIDPVDPLGVRDLDTALLLRRIDPGVCMILSSGDDGDPVLDGFRDHGFDGCIRKPFRADEMVGVIASVLS